MRIDIITVVPDLLKSPFESSILKNSIEKGVVNVVIHNLRDYSANKYKSVDDYQFGGGAGMVLMIEPIDKCVSKLKSERNYDEITPHIYAVKLLVPNSREKLQNYLLSQGIQTGYHYFPNHLLTFFQKKGEVLPEVESIFPNLLTLPSHVGVSKKDIKLIFFTVHTDRLVTKERFEEK